MGLPRLYYTLPELAEKWQRSENDLLHMAAAGELVLSVEYTGLICVLAKTRQIPRGSRSQVICYPESCFHRLYSMGVVQLSSEDANRVLDKSTDGPVLISFAFWKGERVRITSEDFSRTTYGKRPKFDFLTINNLADLKVHISEAERVGNKFFPELARKEHAGPVDDDGCLAGQGKIEPYLKHSWNTCKKYMRKFGVNRDDAGHWLLPRDIANQILKEHPPKKSK